MMLVGVVPNIAIKCTFCVHRLHHFSPENGQSVLHPTQSNAQSLPHVVQIICPLVPFGVSLVGSDLWQMHSLLLRGAPASSADPFHLVY